MNKKELSIGQKAKAYDEALERARNLYKDAIDMGENIRAKQCEIIFPELKESEDGDNKRISKEITQFLKQNNGWNRAWLAWLEKQGQKFHEGDFIKYNKANIICKVISVNSGSYYVENIGTSGRIELFNAEQNFHLWTIKDAKDGNVLTTSSGSFIYNGNNGGGSCPGSYCGINTLGKFQIGAKTHWTGKPVFPATKEQCDTLFVKMKEAGYEWDADKKELKEIEQNPAWSEEDEMFVHGLIRGLSAKRDIHGHTTFSSDCIDITETINWLKSLKQRIGG